MKPKDGVRNSGNNMRKDVAGWMRNAKINFGLRLRQEAVLKKRTKTKNVISGKICYLRKMHGLERKNMVVRKNSKKTMDVAKEENGERLIK